MRGLLPDFQYLRVASPSATSAPERLRLHVKERDSATPHDAMLGNLRVM